MYGKKNPSMRLHEKRAKIVHLQPNKTEWKKYLYEEIVNWTQLIHQDILWYFLVNSEIDLDLKAFIHCAPLRILGPHLAKIYGKKHLMTWIYVYESVDDESHLIRISKMEGKQNSYRKEMNNRLFVLQCLCLSQI